VCACLQNCTRAGFVQVGALEDCDKPVVSSALGSMKEVLGELGAQPMLPWLEKVGEKLSYVV